MNHALLTEQNKNSKISNKISTFKGHRRYVVE